MAIEPLILAGAILGFQDNHVMLIITGLSGGLLPVTLLLLDLDKSGIQYKWIPFQKKSRTISWTSVEKAEVIQYDYVGHGYRISRKYGTVHNVTGKMGLQIILKRGEKLLIGTQKPEAMKDFLSTLSL